MFEDWRKLLSLFSAQERRRIGLLLVVSTLTGLMQAVGIASVMPFIAVVADPAMVTESPYLAQVYAALGFTDTHQLLLVLGVFALVTLLLTNALVGVNAWLTLRICHLGEYDLARRLLQRYMTLPFAQVRQRNSSDLVRMLVAEIDRVVIVTLMAGIGVFSDAITTLFIVGMLLLLHPWVTLATLLVLALAYVGIYWKVTPSVVRLGAEFPGLSAEIFRHANEALGAAREIRLLGRAGHFVDRFARPLLRSSRNAIRYSTLNLVPGQVLELVAFGGLIAVTIYLVGRTQDGGEILPMIAMFGFAAYRLIPAIEGIVDGVEAIRYNMAAIDPLWRDLGGGTEPTPTSAVAVIRPRAGIRLESVRFRHPGARCDTLHGVDLQFEAERWTCLVGPTGAGKSTVIDVLTGLLEPTVGRLIVDDTPITAGNLRGWQDSIGYVAQSVYLIDDTIASNIAFGLASHEIDAERLARVARLAGIHDFITQDLPDGYQTMVGERGARLSGGQRQRIGIARALYHDPPVLVLDEATNELDLATEGRILHSLRQLAGRTIVFVSHKPSVAASCDQVYVLDRGRVIAGGSYAVLAQSGSPHRELLAEP